MPPNFNFPHQPFEAFDSESSYPDISRSSRNRELAPYEQESFLELMNSPVFLNPNQAFYGLPPSPPPFTIPSMYNSPVLSAAPIPTARQSTVPSQSVGMQYQPPTALSQVLTTASIPPGCFQELISHPPFCKEADPNNFKKWGGPIGFSPVDVPANELSLGTPMIDCLQGIGLRDPDTRLFSLWAAAGKTHIHFNIMWPGYPQLDWIVPISIYGLDGRLVTKRELAHRVATQYQKFTNMCTHSQISSQKPRWRVGPGAYTLDRMRLSMIYWVHGDVWQAGIRVITDKNPDPKGLKPMRDLSRRK